VNSWRADFPLLDQHVNGYPLTYLDSAATTQRPTAVMEALLDFYRSVGYGTL
jgi:cysteine desulfurase/selenocysteine lyase